MHLGARSKAGVTHPGVRGGQLGGQAEWAARWAQPTSQRPPSCVLLVDGTDYIHPENHHTSEVRDHRCMFGRIEQGWRQ